MIDPTMPPTSPTPSKGSSISPVSLRIWIVIAAAILVVSATVHFSTFFRFDPMDAVPGVMFIHVLIFAPLGAAIYYARKVGTGDNGHQQGVMKAAPAWLRVTSGVFFAYAVINFVLFIILTEGGGPQKKDGKYVLSSHGDVLREITEEEFHRQQAYIVRGFSGHWMAFTSAALTLLVGASRLRSGDVASAPTAVDSKTQLPKPTVLPPEPAKPGAAVLALSVYATCLVLIISGRPALAALAAPPVIVGAVLAIRRRRGFPQDSFETVTGCLSVIPNFFFAVKMARQAAEFVYVAAAVGPAAAIGHRVTILFPKNGPSQLSNGAALNNRGWAALMILFMFPLIALGLVGLTHMTEYVGRVIEVRNSRRAQM